MNDAQLLRYSRHILLDEIGVEGQQRLLNASALIVGVGGLGSPAALYLAAAGVGKLILADGDEVDLTNLQRQILHRETSVGRPKVESGRETLGQINPETVVHPIKARISDEALFEIVDSVDVVLDCTDNFATRHQINKACHQAQKPLVSGAGVRFDGQVTVFDMRRPLWRDIGDCSAANTKRARSWERAFAVCAFADTLGNQCLARRQSILPSV